MIQAVIFDIDGTLLDSVDLHAQAWQQAFGHFGFDISFDKIRVHIGMGADRLIPSLLGEQEARRIGDKVDPYRSALFKREYLPQVRPFPCVRELFLRLRRDNKRVVLGTSAKGDELAAYKRIANISDLVEDETSADDAESSKPAPDIFQAALEKLHGVSAAETIVVGDTPYDAEAAGKAGLRTVGVLCGGSSEKDLRRAGCIEIYRDACHLLGEYGSSALAVSTVRVA